MSGNLRRLENARLRETRTSGKLSDARLGLDRIVIDDRDCTIATIAAPSGLKSDEEEADEEGVEGEEGEAEEHSVEVEATSQKSEE